MAKDMSRTAGLYIIMCLANGKQYIGQSSYVKNRFAKHKSLLRRGVHENRKLQTDFTLYGEDMFTFSRLEQGLGAPTHERLALERELLQKMCKSHLYNLDIDASSRTGENNAFFGKKHSMETRRHLSNVKKRLPSNFEGHRHSEETKQKMRAAQTGKIYPSCRGPRGPAVAKKVSVYGIAYGSVNEAFRCTGMSRTTIRSHANSSDPRHAYCYWLASVSPDSIN
jgi:group I intron endonuclease